MSDDLYNHILDIKERTARMEEKLDAHVALSAKRDAAIEELREDVLKAKASVATLRWLSGVVFITIPGTLLALFKVVKGG